MLTEPQVQEHGFISPKNYPHLANAYSGGREANPITRVSKDQGRAIESAALAQVRSCPVLIFCLPPRISSALTSPVSVLSG
jgi:hypothetical protein